MIWSPNLSAKEEEEEVEKERKNTNCGKFFTLFAFSREIIKNEQNQHKKYRIIWLLPLRISQIRHCCCFFPSPIGICIFIL